MNILSRFFKSIVSSITPGLPPTPISTEKLPDKGVYVVSARKARWIMNELGLPNTAKHRASLHIIIEKNKKTTYKHAQKIVSALRGVINHTAAVAMIGDWDESYLKRYNNARLEWSYDSYVCIENGKIVDTSYVRELDGAYLIDGNFFKCYRMRYDTLDTAKMKEFKL